MASDGWTYNCPQFVDFTSSGNLPADDLESYFGFDHENGGVPVQLGTPSVMNSSDAFATPPSAMTRSKTTPGPLSKTTPGPLSNMKGGVSKENVTPQSQNIPPVRTQDSRSKMSSKVNTPEILNTPEVISDVKPRTPNTVEKEYAAEARCVMDTAVEAKPTATNICTNLEKWRQGTRKQTKAPSQMSDDRPQRIKRPNQAPGRSEESQPKRLRSSTPQRQAVAPAKPSGLQRSKSCRVVRNTDGPAAMARSETLQKQQKPCTPQNNGGLRRSGSIRRVRGGSEERHAKDVSTRSETLQKQQKPCTPQNNGGLRRSGSIRRVRSGSEERRAKDVGTPKLTMPTTPTLLKRQPVKTVAQLKNSEQRELENIAYYRQELAKKRKLAEESRKVAMSTKRSTCTVSKKEPTQPHEFHFQTDDRLKAHPADTKQDLSEASDFQRRLRSNSAKASKFAIPKDGMTKPEPFKLTEGGQKRKVDTGKEEYKSMAQRLKAFNATPERFRSKSRVKSGRSPSPPRDVTVPKTPNFETRTRSRPVTAPTREELEQREVEEMKRNQFKAHGVNPRILTRSETGIKKVPSKPTTVPEAFPLSSNNRRIPMNVTTNDDEHHTFHAQPLNKKILVGVTGVKAARAKTPTIPESPAFALKHRARIPVEVKEKETGSVPLSRAVPHHGIPFQPRLDHKITQPQPFRFDEMDRHRSALKARKIEQQIEDEAQVEEYTVKAHAVPHSGIPFQPKRSHKTTVVEPFGFDERDRNMLARKEEKINEILESESKMHEFQANPLPCHEPHLPPKRTRPVTRQEPFVLNTDHRGMKKAEEWSAKLEEELHKQRQNLAFKAHKPKVLEQDPFQPLVDHKHTTDVNAFDFNTAKRSAKREAFETFKKEKQDEIDNISHQRKKMKEAEELAEAERRRKEAVHQAKPIKHYKQVVIKQSVRPPTEAVSPRFKTDSRLRARHGKTP